jgi:DNA polymerase/3'-5' exonuclease PolX
MSSQLTRRQIEMPDSWEDPFRETVETVEKRKFPRELCFDVARELLVALAPLCDLERVRVCGSLRRRKRMVGDIEFVFVPKTRVVRPETLDLFGTVASSAVTEAATAALLDELVARGVLARRLKADGTATWGRWNRLAVHVESGVPLDFFGCAEVAFWNTVVSRTGGARNNTEIARAAIRKGWHWEPSPETSGFRRNVGLSIERHPVTSERDVFDFVEMPYRDPWDRE